MTADGVRGRRRLAAVLLVTGITALAFNLRPAITSLPPVFPELSSNLGLSSAAVTALATIPVLCFGVFSGPAARLGRRFGEEQALFAALIVLAVGLALRGGFPKDGLFPATALAAAAIAIMNVLLSGLIKRRMPERAGLLIGIYLLSLSVGAIVGSLISVPVYQASGGSARLVLGLWAVPAAVAAVMWLPQVSRRLNVASPKVATDAGTGARPVPADAGACGRSVPRRSSAGHAVHRHLLGWQVAGFMGLQSLTYYATLSWLPILFRDRGASPEHAGVLISVATLGGAFTSLIVPVLAHRAADQRLLVVPTVVVSGVGIAAALFAPMSTATFWMFVLGLGQGAALGLAIFFTMARAATPASGVPVLARAERRLSPGEHRPLACRVSAHGNQRMACADIPATRDHRDRACRRLPGIPRAGPVLTGCVRAHAGAPAVPLIPPARSSGMRRDRDKWARSGFNCVHCFENWHLSGPSDRQGDRLSHRQGDRLSHRQGDRLSHRQGDRLSHRQGDRLSHRQGDRLSHRQGDRLSHRQGDRLSHRQGDRLSHRQGDRLSHRQGDRLSHRLGTLVATWLPRVACLAAGRAA